MEIVSSVFKDLIGIWKEMFDLFIEYIPKFLIVTLWFICGIIILPCVFVAGNFYPKWTEWGEKL